MGILIALISIGLAVGVPVVAIVALTKASRNARQLGETREFAEQLWRRMASLEEGLAEIRARLDPTPAPDGPSVKGPVPVKRFVISFDRFLLPVA